MKPYRIICLDAFTLERFSGNPCAVLPEANGLSDDQMQKIARETNLSETVFVLPSDRADVRVRYFMPHKEIPFAGHPTIATAFMLAQEGMLPATEAVSRVDFEFNIGVLPVEIHWDGNGNPAKAVMTQKKPTFGPRLDPQALSNCLGLRKGDVATATPLQVVNTGVPFLMVPIGSMEGLRNARMERPLLQSLLENLQVDAAYLFCLGGIDPGADLHGRLFSPGSGSEDPFTGAAVGCAGAYVIRHGLVSGPDLKVEQGHLIGRPGEGTVNIIGSADGIEAVQVGGAAVKTLDGFIYV